MDTVPTTSRARAAHPAVTSRGRSRAAGGARGAFGSALAGDAAVGKRCWKLRCQEPLPHGQTNGPAVDRRGAGCGCPRTCRWGIC